MALLFYHFSLGLMVHYSLLPAMFPSHCLAYLVGSYMSLKAHWWFNTLYFNNMELLCLTCMSQTSAAI